MFNSIFYRTSWFYVPHKYSTFRRLEKIYLQIDSFFCQGISVGQTPNYKIYFYYNKRLPKKKDQKPVIWIVPLVAQEILFTRMFWIYSLFDSKYAAYF